MKFSDYNLMIEDESIPEGKVILCNLFSGATFLIDAETKNKIDSKNAESLSDEDIEDFCNAGVLLKDDNIDEARIHSYYYEKQKFDNGTLSLTILLTMACNLRCVYCYEGAGVLSNATLTDEIRNNIFDFIKEQAETRRSKSVVLWLFGGEPLLYLKDNVEFLQKVQDYCIRKIWKSWNVLIAEVFRSRLMELRRFIIPDVSMRMVGDPTMKCCRALRMS